MIILGVDPGSRITGYAFLEKNQKGIRVLEYGVIRCKPKEDLVLRIGQIHHELSIRCQDYHPQLMSMESSFFGKNARTAMVLGHVRGAIMTLCHQFSMKFAEYAPTEIKQWVSGNGSTNKTAIAWMMQRHLQLQEIPAPEDASDALAAAWTYLEASKHNI